MKQNAARTSLSIIIITSAVLVMTVSFLIASTFEPGFLIPGLLLAAIAFICYLFAPVAFELSHNRLAVFSRLGKKEFSPVIRCSSITQKIPFGIRLWGNGGLFAGTGIFWNKVYGVFRAYVTSSKQTDLVLVETEKRKIVISPENRDEFLDFWETSHH